MQLSRNYQLKDLEKAFRNGCTLVTFEELAKYLLSGSLESKTLTLWYILSFCFLSN